MIWKTKILLASRVAKACDNLHKSLIVITGRMYVPSFEKHKSAFTQQADYKSTTSRLYM